MRPYPLSVQLYSVREAAKKDFIGTLKRIAAFGYHGVEFAGLHGHQPAEIRRVIDDLGLQATSCHGALPTPENISQIVDEAKALGYVWHVYGKKPEAFESKETTLKTVGEFKQAVELLKKNNIKMAIHNHEMEFNRKFDGKIPHKIIMDDVPGLFAQIDTYWVQVGGCDVAETIRGYAKRVPFLHIKDGPGMRGKNMTAVGEGIMQWEPVIQAADSSGVEWLIVELDYCDTDMMEAIKKSRDFLVSKGYAKK